MLLVKIPLHQKEKTLKDRVQKDQDDTSTNQIEACKLIHVLTVDYAASDLDPDN